VTNPRPHISSNTSIPSKSESPIRKTAPTIPQSLNRLIFNSSLPAFNTGQLSKNRENAPQSSYKYVHSKCGFNSRPTAPTTDPNCNSFFANANSFSCSNISAGFAAATCAAVTPPRR